GLGYPGLVDSGEVRAKVLGRGQVLFESAAGPVRPRRIPAHRVTVGGHHRDVVDTLTGQGEQPQQHVADWPIPPLETAGVLRGVPGCRRPPAALNELVPVALVIEPR